jgi:hypothetical protein
MKEPSPLSDPPMIGSVTGCSTVDQSAPDAEQGGALGSQPLPVSAADTAAERTCRYNWVGDRMRERLDALEKERSETCVCGDPFSLHRRTNHSPTSDRPNCPQLNILDP